MKNQLSPTMQEAVRYANEHGGKLVRYPGGFWCKDGLMGWQRPWFGTSTIEAIVKRGAAEYTQWKDGLRGRFPVEVTILDASSKPTVDQTDTS